MVVIRLTRVGKRNSPAYRVVVADKRRAVKRKFIEVIGHYNPTQKPKEIVIDKERALFWLARGAAPSDTVRNLMADLDILKKSEKIKKVYGKAQKKKELKEAAEGKKPEAVNKVEETTEELAKKTEDASEASKEDSEKTAAEETASAENTGDAEPEVKSEAEVAEETKA